MTLVSVGPVIQSSPLAPSAPDRRQGVERRRLELEALDFAAAKAKTLEGFEKRFLATVLAQARGNVTAAAQLAGTERRYLSKLIKKRGFDKTPYHA